MDPLVLIIDDDSIFSTMAGKKFQNDGWNVLTAGTAEEGLACIRKRTPDVILIDVRLPDRLGVEIVPEIKKAHPQLPVVMISVTGEPQYVISAIKNGASDYVIKPVDFPNLLQKVRDLLEMKRIKGTELELKELEGAEFVMGPSAATRQLVRDISRVANSDTTVLLMGETGVGKNMIAQIIHSLSRRRQGKFVEFSCAAVSEQFLESDLFGHERGAFAGAHREKPGKFELADHGTIFLDEIGELAHELQAKLLRVLQGGEFERIGGLKTVKVDVRVIASTNHNLEKAIAEGRFREDLFYRLNVLSILIPTLRERREDIPFLVERFLRFYSKKSAKRFEKISDDIMNGLIDYSWPGNVRELQNVIERAVVLGREPRLEFSDFALSSSPGPHLAESPISPETSEDAFHSLRELEQKTLLDAIRRSSGNVAKAARILGISRGTVYRRLRKYDIGLKSALG